MGLQGANPEQQRALEIAEAARSERKSVGLAGKLFLGELDIESFRKFPAQSEEDVREGEGLIQALDKLLREEVDGEEVDRTKEIPKEVIRKLGEMGAFAIKIPKEYEGLGLSQTNYGKAVMRVASQCGGTAVLLSAHQSIGVPQPLKMYGTEEQKAEYFPRFRKGAISAFALTEPEVGSDPARMSATAKLNEEGTHYILNGEKLWCTNGTVADVIVVMALTGSKEISAFIVDMDLPGVEVVHRCEFMGLGGIYNGVLRFTDVAIPKKNLIWKEGRGLAIALGTINVGRLTLPFACLGGAKQCLSVARRWGKARVQWGLPVGEHEAGAEKLAYIAATTFAIEALAYFTSGLADLGDTDLRIEAAMAKLFCTEELWNIADLTLQLRGGRGYEKARSLQARGEPPFPIERILRDSRINRILEGSTEIMRLFLAREAMDPHLQRILPLLSNKKSMGEKLGTGFSALLHYSLWYPKQSLKSFLPPEVKDFGPLAGEMRYVEKRSRKLAKALFRAMLRYGARLERHQLLLGRLVQIGTELFAMATTCGYARHLNDSSAAETALHFCKIARRRIDHLFFQIKENDDQSAVKLAKNIRQDRLQWLEKGIMEIPD